MTIALFRSRGWIATGRVSRTAVTGSEVVPSFSSQTVSAGPPSRLPDDSRRHTKRSFARRVPRREAAGSNRDIRIVAVLVDRAPCRRPDHQVFSADAGVFELIEAIRRLTNRVPDRMPTVTPFSLALEMKRAGTRKGVLSTGPGHGCAGNERKGFIVRARRFHLHSTLRGIAS